MVDELKQLVIDYVKAVKLFEVTQQDKDFEACETIWLRMMEFAKEHDK